MSGYFACRRGLGGDDAVVVNNSGLLSEPRGGMGGGSLATFSLLAEDDVGVKSPLLHGSGVRVWLSLVLLGRVAREPFVRENPPPPPPYY